MKWFIIGIIASVIVYTQADLNKSKSHEIQDRTFGKSHKKRGVLGAVPTFSKGYDFPIVKHSILKPFIVDYPVRSLPLGVKIPVKAPVAEVKYPVPVGHHPPVPYPGFGLKFPTHQNPTHIHPTVVKSEWPVKCAPNIPEAPTVTKTVISAPLPTPAVQVAPTVFHPPHIFHAPAAFPAPAFLPAPAPAFLPAPPPPLTPVLPLARPPIPFVSRPLIPVHTPVVATAPAPSILRPGNSIHTSFFGTFPKHPIINTAHVEPFVPVAHQPIVPIRVPTGPHFNVPFNVLPSAVGINKFPVGVIPSGPHFPVGNVIHPQFVNVAQPPRIPLGVLPGEHQFPINQIPVHDVHPDRVPLGVFPSTPQAPVHHFPINIAPENKVPLDIFPASQQPPLSSPFDVRPTFAPVGVFPTAQVPFNQFPTNIAPTDKVPLDLFPSSPQTPFGIRPTTTPIGIFPTAPTPTGGFPIISNDIPVAVGPSPTNIPLGVGPTPSDIPVAVGPSPTNVPLGVGQFPIGQNPLFINRPNIPGAGPTIFPTGDSGIIPTVQQDSIDSFGNGIQPIDSNPWIPMNPTEPVPFPNQPQFVPEEETKFAPTDNTNINDEHQGYHYQPNSNIPFEEINERFRNREQQRFPARQNERFRNHFSLRQHLPLRRPHGNFAGFS